MGIGQGSLKKYIICIWDVLFDFSILDCLTFNHQMAVLLFGSITANLICELFTDVNDSSKGPAKCRIPQRLPAQRQRPMQSKAKPNESVVSALFFILLMLTYLRIFKYEDEVVRLFICVLRFYALTIEPTVIILCTHCPGYREGRRVPIFYTEAMSVLGTMGQKSFIIIISVLCRQYSMFKFLFIFESQEIIT